MQEKKTKNKNKELGPISQHLQPSPRNRDRRILGVYRSASLVEQMSSRFNEKSCLNILSGNWLGKTLSFDLLPPLADINKHTHTFMHNVHIQIYHTQKYLWLASHFRGSVILLSKLSLITSLKNKYDCILAIVPALCLWITGIYNLARNRASRIVDLQNSLLQQGYSNSCYFQVNTYLSLVPCLIHLT